MDPLLKSLLDQAGDAVPGFDDNFMSDLLGRLTPPNLDDLEDEHGESEDDDFWPVIRIKLSPDTKVAWDKHVADHESDLAALKNLLGVE